MSRLTSEYKREIKRGSLKMSAHWRTSVRGVAASAKSRSARLESEPHFLVPLHQTLSRRIAFLFAARAHCRVSSTKSRGLPFAACRLSHQDKITAFRSVRSVAFLKFLFKILVKRETNLMQECSANQHQVIMPS